MVTNTSVYLETPRKSLISPLKVNSDCFLSGLASV